MVNKKTIDKISILIVIVFSILGIMAYVGYFNLVYDFVGWSVDGPIIIDDPSFPWGYQTVHFVTTAMSAQNPIKVIATIDLDEKTVTQDFKDKYLTGKEFLFLVLPLAYPAHPDSPEATRNTPFIVLKHTEKSYELRGEFDIKYPFEGTYDYLYFTTEDMKKFQDNSGRSFSLSAAAHRNVNDTITIESSEITSNLQTNNIFLTLTIVAIAFGSIELIQNRFKS